MISVIQVNKQGRRIIDYICVEGKSKKHIIKDELYKLIKKGKVANAKAQIYKGTTIIRLKDSNIKVVQLESEQGTVQQMSQATKAENKVIQLGNEATNEETTMESIFQTL